MKLIFDVPEEIYEALKGIAEDATSLDPYSLADIIVNKSQLYEERPHGEWIPKQLWDNTHVWVCSECGNQNTHGITVEKACWKCGAQMKGGAE